MTNMFSAGMAKATELTRQGKLQEATDLIRALLHGGPAPAPGQPEGDVIDGTATRLDAAPKAPPTAAPDPAPARAAAPRSGLRETLRRIAAGGMPAAASGPRPQADTGPGRFVTLTHASAQGRRDYRLYTPVAHKAEGKPMPLVVMLHGCTQSPDDFAAGTGMNALAEEFGCIIAYPAQPTGANANKCWNWFKPEDQRRDGGEPALIAGIARDILRDHPVDPARVYIAGLSAGGAAAAIVAAAYPELFHAVGVHSGLPVGAARDVPSAFAAMQQGGAGSTAIRTQPTIILHGLADATVHPRNGDAVARQVLSGRPGLAKTVQRGTSAGGRGWRQTSHSLPDGRSHCEHWEIEGAGHAWAGGKAAGSHTDPAGPDASREMLRFFLQHRGD
ncbi:PHB depolymerase family esterase [Paracoccaceae bacterium Fryx2]|nr:PHB depolymerase family esterase [Paracoccaceae bacterium Fryx2]